jgi:two-component system, NtrC family, sensor kinase
MGIPARGLAFRLSLYLAAAVAVVLGLFGLWAVHESRSHLEQSVIDSADRVCDVIRRSTRSFMFRNERREIFEIIQAIGEQPNFDRIRIYDKEGRIQYSTVPSEVATKADPTAEACIKCHSGHAPRPTIDRNERYRVFRNADGHRTLGMIAPIENEPACSNADCHIHPPGQRILGVLDAQMSLADVDRQMAGLTLQMTVSTILALIGLISLFSLILHQLVHRPVRKLIQGTKRIAAGDLASRVPVRSQDEIRELAESFNQMTDDLGQARTELEAWARTLEQRVAEKTRALEKVQEEILQMERMASMGKLAAIVAHEINNPLAGIRTYAHLLVKKAQRRLESDAASAERDRESVEMLSQIETESARCGDIVKNLLQFSRPSRPRAEPVDVSQLAAGSVRLVQHQIDLQGLKSHLDLTEKLEPIVCDAQQIRQAMVAVLINACEAMGNEGILTVRTRSAAGGGVEIAVEDTGVGIDEETRKHLFEPFYTTKEKGAGLGLAVVYGIITNHGGRIEVESSPGQGTTLRIFLPAKPPARGPEAGLVG